MKYFERAFFASVVIGSNHVKNRSTKKPVLNERFSFHI